MPVSWFNWRIIKKKILQGYEKGRHPHKYNFCLFVLPWTYNSCVWKKTITKHLIEDILKNDCAHLSEKMFSSKPPIFQSLLMKGDLDEQAQESEMETKFIKKKKKIEKR